MNWIKTHWKAFLAGLAAFLAILAAASIAKANARAEKWARVAEDEKAKDVADSTGKAGAALIEAKKHTEKAAAAKANAEAKIDAIAEKDPAVADIVAKWKKDRLK
jgi:F0F1-type ATP synthase membrane subunit c/vacuolar-type H+-ATPase subunit K